MISQQDILNAKILIVDDQLPNVLLLRKMLQAAGYTAIHSTTDSREAVKLYQEFRPDLLALDLRMPHIDGFEVMGQLRKLESSSYLPILVLTADDAKVTRQRALESGAKDFLSKPLDQAEVFARIHNLLEVRLLYNQILDQNEVLEEKVRERTKALYATQLEIVRRLGLAAEYRDNETGMHITRMSLYSSLLALEAGLSDADAELVLNASAMHDIGKIGIPDHILLKPGKLDADEWAMMQTHATLGANLLAGHESALMHMAHAIALSHHERWDGAGYPQGLRGDDIPLTGRICAISDVFDALTSERPYKRAWTEEEAIAELEQGKGSQFEPHLVELFRQVLPEVRQIRAQYAN
ncbi:MAG: two-component system response regulator [Dehalococcoidia bacterium]|nr:two-component system response regulator [Dehalococcoidia bacterium]